MFENSYYSRPTNRWSTTMDGSRCTVLRLSTGMDRKCIKDATLIEIQIESITVATQELNEKKRPSKKLDDIIPLRAWKCQTYQFVHMKCMPSP